MTARLTPAQIAAAAKTHGIEPAALRAVIAVETGGLGGFLPDGRPRILFEGHILWKRLREGGRDVDPAPLHRARPDLCYPKWTRKHYRGGAGEWDRMNAVIQWGRNRKDWESIHKAALESASWGLFQLMGFNYAAAGFENVYEFILAHSKDEESHLAAILRWMGETGILPYLQRRDWIRFTARYNGPGQVPIYSARLVAAYAREKRRER